MKFFSKLRATFRSSPDTKDSSASAEELASLHNDSRVHPRRQLNRSDIALLRLHTGLEGFVQDISYGGIAVRFEQVDTTFLDTLQASHPATLMVLGRKAPCRLQAVRSAALGKETFLVGFALQHDTSDMLIFMREILERMRCGTSLVAIERSMRHERYQGEGWSYLRGDGPTDLIIKMNQPEQQLVEALLTFRVGNTYCEVSFKEGRLRTGRTKQAPAYPMRVGGNMVAVEPLDSTLLYQGFFTLLGASPTCSPLVQPMLERILEHLQNGRGGVTAA